MNKSHARKQLLAAFDPHAYERPGLSSQEIMEIKSIFDMFDSDATGLAKVQEMIRSLDQLGSEPKDQMLYFILQQLHKDKVTQIYFYEFLEMITHRVNNKTNRRNMNKIFGLLDENKGGSITVETLKKVAQDIGDSIEESQLKEMIERADLNGDGIVSQEQFYLFMTDKKSKQGDH